MFDDQEEGKEQRRLVSFLLLVVIASNLLAMASNRLYRRNIAKRQNNYSGQRMARERGRKGYVEVK